jgi:hypothetical protein
MSLRSIYLVTVVSIQLQNSKLTIFSTSFSCYGFAVESFVIQANLVKLQAMTALQRRIFQFYEDWDSEDSLTIYVYSGHGALVEGGNNKQYLIA